MNTNDNQQKLIISGIIGGLVILGFAISLLYSFATQNPYGKSIPINNYDAIVKNISSDYKDSITAALYQMVEFNSSREQADKVRDAIIRDNSALQDEVSKNKQYGGSFIVDMESIKQSYLIQYEYSVDKDDGFVSGYPILVSCLDTSKLIYGDFGCKNMYESAREDAYDPIVGNLPKTTLSYKLYADTSSGELIIKAELRIPQSDLSGDVSSKKEVVNLYKNEVNKWFESTGFVPSNYTIKYNYDDSGNKISL